MKTLLLSFERQGKEEKWRGFALLFKNKTKAGGNVNDRRIVYHRILQS